MAISIASASAKDKLSEAFLKNAIEGNFAEVSMGELAQKNGQSDGVKSYGKMLSTDHAAANQKALDIAEYTKASKIKDAAGEYASGQIDTLQKHLDTAKSLKAGK
jgi:putative membrane protein